MIWWAIGLAAIAALAWSRVSGPGLGRLIDQAVKREDVSPVVQRVVETPETARPTAFDQAVNSLWTRYERGLAAKLVHGAAPSLGTASIAQYWIRQVMEVEPEIGNSVFDEEFLRAVYQPERAAKCGRFG